MTTIRIDGALIRDENTFHDVCAAALGFPDYYGRNMDAWIDCLGDQPSSPLVLHVDNARLLKQRAPDVWLNFLECAAFVNWRCVSEGLPALVTVSAYA